MFFQLRILWAFDYSAAGNNLWIHWYQIIKMNLLYRLTIRVNISNSRWYQFQSKKYRALSRDSRCRIMKRQICRIRGSNNVPAIITSSIWIILSDTQFNPIVSGTNLVSRIGDKLPADHHHHSIFNCCLFLFFSYFIKKSWNAPINRNLLQKC